MNKTFVILSMTLYIAGSVLIGCQTSAEKEKNAQDKVQSVRANLGDAKNNLNEIQAEQEADYQQFRKDAEEKLDAQDKSVAEFKARVATEKRENKAEYEKELLELEKKNTDMKKRLDEYKAEGKDKWEAFKTEFGRDMENLGAAFKNLTVKNK